MSDLRRTDMHCHNCSKGFVAEIDFGITGNHVVECPRCGHEHFRVIEDGQITEERWNHKYGASTRVPNRSVWKANDLQMQTSVAAVFIRDRWLNRSDRPQG